MKKPALLCLLLVAPVAVAHARTPYTAQAVQASAHRLNLFKNGPLAKTLDALVRMPPPAGQTLEQQFAWQHNRARLMQLSERVSSDLTMAYMTQRDVRGAASPQLRVTARKAYAQALDAAYADSCTYYNEVIRVYQVGIPPFKAD